MTRNRKASKTQARKASHRMTGGRHSSQHEPKAVQVHEARGRGGKAGGHASKGKAATPAQLVRRALGGR